MNNPLSGGHRAARVMDVVADALERTPAERAAFLLEACGGDESLRAEVRSLLDQEAGMQSFLTTPAFAVTSGRLFGPDPGELRPGDVLGDCRIIRFVGEGGTGEVYLAQDTRLERQVALKLLKRHFDEEELRRRFHHERRVLAGLTHPYIARLYGGAATPAGRPYLVMEYVEGERLDHYCEARGVDVNGRLELFRKVCAAVAYAHQNLVIHRDLKPANIRVTPEGEPRLLDFGIAKLLDPEGTGSRTDPTVTMQAMMTPEYASPEQLRGEPITTATDVYSLGVMLYELLTGQRPYQLKGRRADELARAICEEEPPRPSTVAGRARTAATIVGQTMGGGEPPARLRRRLEGDLDNIVAKALRKEPGRRYASVAAFSEDVHRHCGGLPVTARKDTLGYRAGKFVRRNKAGVAAAALVLLALVGGLAATISQARRANLEAGRANARFEEVRQLAHSFLFEVEPQIAHLPGSIPARRTLVKRALEYLDNLSREAGSRSDLRRELAAAYEKVGDVQGRPNQPNLGDYEGALASYHKGRDLRRSLVAANAQDAQARHELAACDEHLGEILWWSSQTAAAAESLHEALALERRLVAEQPHSMEFRRGLASVLVHLGDIPGWTLQSAEALSLYGQARPILEALARDHPQDADLGLELARCLESSANVQQDLGDYPGAMNSLTQAEGIVAPLAQRDPSNDRARTSLWYVLYSETETLLARQAGDQALAICPRMLGTAEAQARANPEDAVSQHDLAISHEAHGAALMQAQRWEEALAALQAALALDVKLVARSSSNEAYVQSSGSYRLEIGRVQFHLGEMAQAEVAAQAAREQLEAVIRLNPDDAVASQELIRVYELEGDLCEQRAHPSQAKQWFQRALAEMNERANMHITASDRADWDALHEKLATKTKSDAIAAQPQ